MTTPQVLVVCVGNVCRSPLAERLLQDRLPGVVVRSAGTDALVGSGMDPEAAQELHALGGSDDGFVARRLTPDMVRDADVVLTATLDIRSRVLTEAPGALRRTFTLVELADLLDGECVDELGPALRSAVERRSQLAGRDLDVPDPFRRGPQAHAEAARRIDEACQQLAASLGSATV